MSKGTETEIPTKAAVIKAGKDRMFLLLLLLLPDAACVKLKTTCPLISKSEGEDRLSYYRPGDHVIGGVKSTIAIASQQQDFNKPPCARNDT